MTELVVEVRELTRRFGNTLALDEVDFQASRGKVYGLVGANGAGKTTLIKHLMGLLRTKSGSVQVFGENPILNPESVLKRIGYLSEERDIPSWMSIDELMRYTQAYHQDWDQAFARELLDTFALDTSQKIKNLSRGMRAQVALVAAVAHRPDLLILDEPSSGLDAVVRMDILNAIVRTISEEGRTVIFSSHLLEEVERMSDPRRAQPGDRPISQPAVGFSVRRRARGERSQADRRDRRCPVGSRQDPRQIGICPV